MPTPYFSSPDYLQAHAQPRDEIALLHAVIDAQRAINATARNSEDVMNLIVEKIQFITGAAGAVLELIDGSDMVYRAASGSVADHVGLRVPVGNSLSGLCITSRESLECTDSELDNRVNREATRRVNARSMVVVPLFASVDECVGVLKVISPEPSAFGPEVRATIELMGQFLATSLRNARQFDERTHDATHDRLTNLPNGALLNDRLSLALEKTKRGGGQVLVFFIDLNSFKQINDVYGHHAGDHVLITVAHRMRTALRGTDTISRLGGDEFVAVLEDLPLEQIESMATRFEQLIETPILFEGTELLVAASIGVAVSTSKDSVTSILKRADAAMYERKRDAVSD